MRGVVRAICYLGLQNTLSFPETDPLKPVLLDPKWNVVLDFLILFVEVARPPPSFDSAQQTEVWIRFCIVSAAQLRNSAPPPPPPRIPPGKINTGGELF